MNDIFNSLFYLYYKDNLERKYLDLLIYYLGSSIYFIIFNLFFIYEQK